jgi:hypothetical protein
MADGLRSPGPGADAGAQPRTSSICWVSRSQAFVTPSISAFPVSLMSCSSTLSRITGPDETNESPAGRLAW